VAFRQLTWFRIGCWVAITTAAFHLAGHVAGPAEPANATEVTLQQLATDYRLTTPGGAERSLMDFLNGLSLAFALSLAVLGSVGLLVVKRAAHDALLMLAVARSLAVGSAGFLAISLSYWFIVPSVFLVMMTLAFSLASVRSPAPSA
jgi:hypothetical protein